MAISLQKGDRVDLTEGRNGLSKITVGLGWKSGVHLGGTPQKPPRTLLGSLIRGITQAVENVANDIGAGTAVDIDSSVFLVDRNNRVVETVYFGNRMDRSGAIRHAGDDRTGNNKFGIVDNEEIYIDLSRIPSDVERLVFVVNIYNCVATRQHFGMIRDAYIRITDDRNQEELLRFSLTDNYDKKTAVFVGEIYRYNGEWKFAAIGEGTNDTSIAEMRRRYFG